MVLAAKGWVGVGKGGKESKEKKEEERKLEGGEEGREGRVRILASGESSFSLQLERRNERIVHHQEGSLRRTWKWKEGKNERERGGPITIARKGNSTTFFFFCCWVGHLPKWNAPVL